MSSEFLTGFHAIEEALAAASRGSGRLYISGKGPRIKKIEELAGKKRTPVQRITSDELSKITGRDHKGIALEIVAARMGSSFEEFMEKLDDSRENVLVLLLDGITDPHNLGAILRSADQFQADFVLFPERRSASETEVVANTSAGAVHHVPHAQVKNLNRTVELLKKKQFWIYGAAMGGGNINQTDLRGRVALVMGSEGQGLSALLAKNCDAEIAIPTRGKVDSLNVSVATGVILYEIRRQQGW